MKDAEAIYEWIRRARDVETVEGMALQCGRLRAALDRAVYELEYVRDYATEGKTVDNALASILGMLEM